MPVVIVVPLLLLVVLLLMVGSRPRPVHSWVHPPPRELVRRALVVIPVRRDAAQSQGAIDRVLDTDPRVDVLVVATVAGGAPGVTTVGPRVALLRPPGQGTPADAVRSGAAHALRRHYDAVVELPAEHAHLARCIPSLLAALDDGAHVALGSRYVPGGRARGCGAVPRLLSRGLNTTLRWCTRLPQHDVAARIRAYRRVAVEEALLGAEGGGWDFRLDVLVRCRRERLNVAEAPVMADGATATTSLAEGRELLCRAVGWHRTPTADGRVRRLLDLTTASAAHLQAALGAPLPFPGQLRWPSPVAQAPVGRVDGLPLPEALVERIG